LNNIITKPIGLIGLDHHSVSGWLAALKDNPFWDLAACADYNANNHEKVRTFFPEARLYEDHRDMIDGELLAASLVLAHPEEKPPIIKDCAENGMAVLCPPPLSDRMDDGMEIIQRCADENVLLHMAFRWHNHPALRELVSLAGADKDEKIKKIQIIYKSPYVSSGFEDDNIYLLEAGSNALNLVSGFISDESYEINGQAIRDEAAGTMSYILNVRSQDDLDIEIRLYPAAGNDVSFSEEISLSLATNRSAYECDTGKQIFKVNGEPFTDKTEALDWEHDLYADVLKAFSLIPLLPGPSPTAVAALQVLDKLLTAQFV
jgi:Oxidoreductase family, NAD-binding Rossmann fold